MVFSRRLPTSNLLADFPHDAFMHLSEAVSLRLFPGCFQ